MKIEYTGKQRKTCSFLTRNGRTMRVNLTLGPRLGFELQDVVNLIGASQEAQ